MPSTIIQARFGETEYAISRLVFRRARTLGLSRSALARRLGYSDLNAGHRALTIFLKTGSTPPMIARRLADALEVEPALVDQVFVATARQQHDEVRARILQHERLYREAFRPHLQIQTQRSVPAPIFVAALLGTARLRFISLPDEVFTANQDAREAVKTLIIGHYRDHAGQVPAFGAITGYVLVLFAGYDGIDFGLPFDRQGDRAGPMCMVRRLPEARLGKKRADGRLNSLLRLRNGVQHHE